jgi:flagellar basal-body rod protein FlgF
MQSGIYVAVSGQGAIQRRLESIASNVANMSTAGYRGDGVRFSAEVARLEGGDVAFAGPANDYISRAAGSLNRTGNSLDVAVQGDGWLGIRTASGTSYTRDGRLKVGATGQLQTITGNLVLDAGGAPIVVNPNGGDISVARDGMITQGGVSVSAIGLFAIDPRARLSRAENSSVVPDRAATPILDFAENGVAQGYVEGSNVDPVVEMTRLIAATRDFEGIASSVSTTEASLSDAIRVLASSQ